MNDIKSVFASKTIWASLIGLLSFAFPLWGPILTTVDPASVSQQIANVVTAVSFFGAIVGRLTATKQVAISPNAAKLLLLGFLLFAGAPMLSACAELAVAAGAYGAVNAGLAAVSPELYSYCVNLREDAARIDGTISAKHKLAADRAKAAIDTVCTQQPASIPQALATVIAAIRAVKAVQAS